MKLEFDGFSQWDDSGCLVLFKEQSSIKVHNMFVEVYHRTNKRRFLKTLEKKRLRMLIRLKKVPTQSLKSLDFTNPDSDKDNLRSFVPSLRSGIPTKITLRARLVIICGLIVTQGNF